MTVHVCRVPLTGVQRRAFTARNDPAAGVVVARISPGLRSINAAVTALMLELGFRAYRIQEPHATQPGELAAAWLRAHGIRHVGLLSTQWLTPAALRAVHELTTKAGCDLWLVGTDVEGAVECDPMDLAALAAHTGPATSAPASWATEVRRYRDANPGRPVPAAMAECWLGTDTSLLTRLRDVTGDEAHAIRLHRDITASAPYQVRRTMDWATVVRDWRPWAALSAALFALGVGSKQAADLRLSDAAPDGTWINLDGFRLALPAPVAVTVRGAIEWVRSIDGDLARSTPIPERRLLTSGLAGTNWWSSTIRTHARGTLRALDLEALCAANW